MTEERADDKAILIMARAMRISEGIKMLDYACGQLEGEEKEACIVKINENLDKLERFVKEMGDVEKKLVREVKNVGLNL